MDKYQRFGRIYEKLDYMVDDVLKKPCFLLFLFTRKKGFELTINLDIKGKPKDIEPIVILIKDIIEGIIKTKIFYEISRIDSKKYIIYFSKEKIPKNKFFKTRMKEEGEFLSIPKCCIKKYLSENKNPGSLNSAIRYQKQLDELKIYKDPFKIEISDGGVHCTYGFVPCSPKCEKSLKILGNYKKIGDKLKNE